MNSKNNNVNDVNSVSIEDANDNGEGFGYIGNDIEGANIINTGVHDVNVNDKNADVQAANIQDTAK